MCTFTHHASHPALEHSCFTVEAAFFRSHADDSPASGARATSRATQSAGHALASADESSIDHSIIAPDASDERFPSPRLSPFANDVRRERQNAALGAA